MALYRQHFPQRSIRSCLFQICPDADDDIILLSEHSDSAQYYGPLEHNGLAVLSQQLVSPQTELPLPEQLLFPPLLAKPLL